MKDEPKDMTLLKDPIVQGQGELSPFAPPTAVKPFDPHATETFNAQAAFNDLNARMVVAEAKLEGLMHKVERLVSEAAKRLWHMVF